MSEEKDLEKTIQDVLDKQTLLYHLKSDNPNREKIEKNFTGPRIVFTYTLPEKKS